MECKECPYYWKEGGDDYPTCQFNSNDPWGVPPCEEEEDCSEYEPW